MKGCLAPHPDALHEVDGRQVSSVCRRDFAVNFRVFPVVRQCVNRFCRESTTSIATDGPPTEYGLSVSLVLDPDCDTTNDEPFGQDFKSVFCSATDF